MTNDEADAILRRYEEVFGVGVPIMQLRVPHNPIAWAEAAQKALIEGKPITAPAVPEGRWI